MLALYRPLILLCALAAVVLVSVPIAARESKELRLVAYYAGWAAYSGREVAHIDAGRLSHLIYAFANIGSDGRLMIGDNTIDTLKLFPGFDVSAPYHGNFGQLQLLKAKHPHLKVLIAVGGWSWSGRFSDVALTPESRRRFAESVVEFVVRFGFDGVDIDWEYPVSGGLASNARRPEDKANFTLLMEELRAQLDDQGERDGRHYLLTFAGAAAPYYTHNVELHRLHRVVDFINLMTYDLAGPWEATTGLNSPLSRHLGAPLQPGWSIQDAVNLYLSHGVPPEKLVVGVPFYGYRFDGVHEAHDGLFQPYVQGAAIPYYSVKPLVESGEFVRHWHEGAQVPYLAGGGTFITYDDPESMRAKAATIRHLGLGGIMIWEISQDAADRSLLRALYDSLFSGESITDDEQLDAEVDAPDWAEEADESVPVESAEE